MKTTDPQFNKLSETMVQALWHKYQMQKAEIAAIPPGSEIASVSLGCKSYVKQMAKDTAQSLSLEVEAFGEVKIKKSPGRMEISDTNQITFNFDQQQEEGEDEGEESAAV